MPRAGRHHGNQNCTGNRITLTSQVLKHFSGKVPLLQTASSQIHISSTQRKLSMLLVAPIIINTPSSSIIMLCMIMHAIMIVEIVSKSHYRIGFFTISHRACRKPKALSTDSLCADSWHFVKCSFIGPCGLYLGCSKQAHGR